MAKKDKHKHDVEVEVPPAAAGQEAEGGRLRR